MNWPNDDLREEFLSMSPVRHLLLGSTLAALVVPSAGCDNNPGGPAAPSVEVAREANANAPPVKAGIMPAKRGRVTEKPISAPGVD
jgi:hypothetical protein